MSQSINYARSKGSLVVCASGNGGGNVVAFPGQTSSCMTVGAIDQDTGGRATFSQYGTGLDIVAPGTNIITPSIITTNLWERGAGTSFAAPHVAAAAALLYAQGLTISQVETKILTTTTDLGTVGWDPETGFGVLNTTAALGVTEPAQAGGASDPDPDPSPDPNPDPDEDSSLPCWQGTISLQAGNAALLPLDCQGQNFTYQLSNGTLSGKSYIPPAFWTGTATLRYRPLQGTTYYIVALNVVARTSKLAAKIKPTRTCLKLTLSRTGLIGKAKTTILVERKVGKKWKRIVASRFAWSKASHTSCLKKPKLRGIYRVRANVQSTTYSTQAASSRTFKL